MLSSQPSLTSTCKNCHKVDAWNSDHVRPLTVSKLLAYKEWNDKDFNPAVTAVYSTDMRITQYCALSQVTSYTDASNFTES